MKIVCISDTHLRHGFDVPDGDVLVHAGDATIRGDFFELKEFVEWFGSLPHKHKIMIAGNHDFLFERSPETARLLVNHQCHYLEDSAVEIEGVTFYGSPWQPRFHDWAFNLDRGAAIARKWKLMPDKVDVLITHGPPLNVLDYTHGGGEHLGCADLAERVKQIKPRLHVFGHIHGGYGKWQRNGTLFVNASICDEAYRPVNNPVVVEL